MRSALATVVVSLCFGLGLACGPDEPPPAPPIKAGRPITKPPPREDLLEVSPIVLTGIRIRVWRRPVTTGVIQVHEERVAERAAVPSREAELLAAGWSAWPPGAAPEAGGALAVAHPALRDCPFLMEESEEPESWLDEPASHIACFRSVAEMEQSRDREEQIHFRHSRALPCAELMAAPRPTDFQYRRELKEVCAAMDALPKEPSEAELLRARRTEQRNTRTVMPIVQR